MNVGLLQPRSAHFFSKNADLVQICFVVENIEESKAAFSRLLGAGPWFSAGKPHPDRDKTTLRGVRSPLATEIALAYAGNTMFELAQPEPDSRSIFSEWVRSHGYGLHHFGFVTRQFEAVESQIKADSREIMMTGMTARGARVLMVDSDVGADVLYELIEVTEQSAEFYARMREAARNWDGVTLDAQ